MSTVFTHHKLSEHLGFPMPPTSPTSLASVTIPVLHWEQMGRAWQAEYVPGSLATATTPSVASLWLTPMLIGREHRQRGQNARNGWSRSVQNNYTCQVPRLQILRQKSGPETPQLTCQPSSASKLTVPRKGGNQSFPAASTIHRASNTS